ncbi:MAG: hypothetical protein JRE36_06845 [Deltaproteobacteria bacterium]|nr:hypothetical protein [Deltaproteobacteria bacterium]
MKLPRGRTGYAGYELRVAGYGVRVAGCGLRVIRMWNAECGIEEFYRF